VKTAYMNDDIVIACADLVGRCGASGFEIGYLHDDVPVEEAGWYAHASYRGARITVENHRSPASVALALAQRLLSGGTCRCRKPVTLSDDVDGCRWRLMGARWEPGCNAPPVDVSASRGDYAAIAQAVAQPMNRAQRRKAERKQQRRRG
jgi:hypothetical protein